MGKAKAKKASKPRAKTKRATKKPVAKASGNKKPGKKTNLLGGVAKGLAWLGHKVRGVVKRKPKKKPKRAAKPNPTAVAAGPTPIDISSTTINPMP